MGRILFVDDEENILKALHRLFYEEKYETFFATNAEEGLELLGEMAFEVVVSDMRMPKTDGIAFLRRVRDISPETRRIILTAHAEIESAISAINDAQVHAYLIKPWREDDLKRVIEGELREFESQRTRNDDTQRMEEQIRQSRETIQELESLSKTDSLTGLPNRRDLTLKLQSEWWRSTRELQNLSVAMIDIDRFKLVNDTAGHAAGDEVLRRIARCLLDSLQRPADYLARCGGEEFVAVLPNTDDPMLVAERMREEVEDMKIPHPGLGEGVVITVSVGVSMFVPGTRAPNLNPERLLDTADKAMYQSKKDGRNRVTMLDLKG